MMPIMEDEHGTYIMNSKDLRAVEHVARLAQIGVDSLKIEGRTKSLYYVARTAQVYRRAIDDAVAGRPFNPELLIELEGLSNRGYTGGLLERRPSNDYQNYINGHSATQRSQYVGEVRGAEGQADVGLAGDWVQVETKNHFAVGDLTEVVHPSGDITSATGPDARRARAERSGGAGESGAGVDSAGWAVCGSVVGAGGGGAAFGGGSGGCFRCVSARWY